jgi:hypothetical protein
MTGRAAGFCAGYPVPGFTNPIMGRGGLGRFGGRGRGRGYRNMYYASGFPGWTRNNMDAYNPNVAYASPAIPPQQEAEALRNQARYLQDNLNALNDRIQELEKLEAETGKSGK